MTRKALAILGLGLVVLAALPVAHAAGGWRTVVVSEDADKSEFGGVNLTLKTNVLNLRAARLVVATTTPLESYTATVDCKRGETTARKDVKLAVTSGIKALPVPLPGGRCSIDVWLAAFRAGAATVKLQVR
ncbi:MAG: hypothetical protein U0R50_16075 [Gaiellales bacterium]